MLNPDRTEKRKMGEPPSEAEEAPPRSQPKRRRQNFSPAFSSAEASKVKGKAKSTPSPDVPLAPTGVRLPSNTEQKKMLDLIAIFFGGDIQVASQLLSQFLQFLLEDPEFVRQSSEPSIQSEITWHDAKNGHHHIATGLTLMTLITFFGDIANIPGLKGSTDSGEIFVALTLGQLELIKRRVAANVSQRPIELLPSSKLQPNQEQNLDWNPGRSNTAPTTHLFPQPQQAIVHLRRPQTPYDDNGSLQTPPPPPIVPSMIPHPQSLINSSPALSSGVSTPQTVSSTQPPRSQESTGTSGTPLSLNPYSVLLPRRQMPLPSHAHPALPAYSQNLTQGVVAQHARHPSNLLARGIVPAQNMPLGRVMQSPMPAMAAGQALAPISPWIAPTSQSPPPAPINPFRMLPEQGMSMMDPSKIPNIQRRFSAYAAVPSSRGKLPTFSKDNITGPSMARAFNGLNQPSTSNHYTAFGNYQSSLTPDANNLANGNIDPRHLNQPLGNQVPHHEQPLHKNVGMNGHDQFARNGLETARDVNASQILARYYNQSPQSVVGSQPVYEQQSTPLGIPTTLNPAGDTTERNPAGLLPITGHCQPVFQPEEDNIDSLADVQPERHTVEDPQSRPEGASEVTGTDDWAVTLQELFLRPAPEDLFRDPKGVLSGLLAPDLFPEDLRRLENHSS